MKASLTLVTLACCLTVGAAGTARAGAPQPDQRAGDFVHVCQGGPKKAQLCSVASEETDCPKSSCVVQTWSKAVRGTLTLIAHDTVTDWLHGGATNRALTALLEVKAPDGSRQMLAATYQDLLTPTEPPAAPSAVVAIGMDEDALQNLAGAVNGLLFVRPESILSQKLQTLFGVSGTPVIVATAKRGESADHTGDDLATVLRFAVKVQFVDPL